MNENALLQGYLIVGALLFGIGMMYPLLLLD